MLSAYPTKHARIGNAVGLDTPASVVRLLAAMAGQGYDIGPFDGPDALPGVADLDGDRLAGRDVVGVREIELRLGGDGVVVVRGAVDHGG